MGKQSTPINYKVINIHPTYANEEERKLKMEEAVDELFKIMGRFFCEKHGVTFIKMSKTRITPTSDPVRVIHYSV